MNKKIFLFFSVCVLFNLAASFAHPITPALFSELGLNSYMFGVAFACMMFTNFIFSPFWGRINDFISSRTSLAVCCAGYALGQVFFGLSQTEIHFVFARLFSGAFAGGVFVSMLTYLVNISPNDKERGANLAILATIQSIGGAFGYFVGGFLGVISIYLAIGAQIAALLISGLLFRIVCVNDAKTSNANISFKKAARDANPFSAFVQSGKFMTPVIAALFLVCTLHSIGTVAFDQTFNYYIKDQFSFNTGYNGALKGIMGFVTLLANSTAAIWLIRKTDIKKSIIYLLTLCSVTMLWIITINGVTMFMTVNVFFFAFSAICIPLLQNIAAEISNDENKNLVMGFYNSLKSFGGIIGAIIAGFIYSANPRFPFVLSFAAFLLATVFAWRYYLASRKIE